MSIYFISEKITGSGSAIPRREAGLAHWKCFRKADKGGLPIVDPERMQ
jgi:hypothetical protein